MNATAGMQVAFACLEKRRFPNAVKPTKSLSRETVLLRCRFGFTVDQRTPAARVASRGVVMIYFEVKSLTKHIRSAARLQSVIHLGSRIVSVIDSATFLPRRLPALWSVRKCWPE